MADWIPVVSQVKSLIQAIAGDAKGALKTQQTFSQTCPVVSQIRSLVEATILGDPVAAAETQLKQLALLSSVADSIPVVGHVKGAVHYGLGDHPSGEHALKAASRSAAVVAGGVGGFCAAGPLGAVLGGMAGGLASDGVTTAAHSAIKQEFVPAGQVLAVADIVKGVGEGENIVGKVFDAAVGVSLDGVAGFAAGSAFEVVMAKGAGAAQCGGGAVKPAIAVAAEEAAALPSLSVTAPNPVLVAELPAALPPAAAPLPPPPPPPPTAVFAKAGVTGVVLLAAAASTSTSQSRRRRRVKVMDTASNLTSVSYQHVFDDVDFDGPWEYDEEEEDEKAGDMYWLEPVEQVTATTAGEPKKK
ncbi:hypothetical protein HDU96_003567 [Phlyctochytrium bullatum]|nr:hypothetical protein HDU96_003567 [Phlyctochytrium bullatum]